ncbi:MAG: hypothetical protein JKY52_00445 [Flavobacteriales bacterium]|nr:hypothetical protein [Flavobacteriales bacterium]
MKNILALLLCVSSSFCKGNIEDSATTSAEGVITKRFEFSFGQSLLFISDSKEIDLRDKEAIILPTSAMLFFVEFRPLNKFRVPVFFNLPTESKQFLVNGSLINERANPSFGTGFQYPLFKFNIDKETILEWEMGPFVNVLIPKRGNFLLAPIAAGRIRIVKKKDFVMYLGTSYSFGIDSWGLIYGTGFLF